MLASLSGAHSAIIVFSWKRLVTLMGDCWNTEYVPNVSCSSLVGTGIPWQLKASWFSCKDQRGRTDLLRILTVYGNQACCLVDVGMTNHCYSYSQYVDKMAIQRSLISLFVNFRNGCRQRILCILSRIGGKTNKCASHSGLSSRCHYFAVDRRTCYCQQCRNGLSLLWW